MNEKENEARRERAAVPEQMEDGGLGAAFERLNAVMDVLLGENGCPWDRAQTHESLKPQFLEECYEVIDAIEQKSMLELCEELGDVLLHLFLQAKLAEKDRQFTMTEVIEGITRKIINRHRHVFGDVNASTSDEIIASWEAVKKEEKKYQSVTDQMRSVPRTFPALMRAQKVMGYGAKAGCSISPVHACTDDGSGEAVSHEKHENKLEDALSVLREEAVRHFGLSEKNDEPVREMENMFGILGGLLLEIANISRISGLNAEFALTNAIKTYINNFENVENAFISGMSANQTEQQIK